MKLRTAQLCDTNVLSELVRPRPNAGVVSWAEKQAVIAVSVVTVDELFFGLSWQPRPRIRAWVESFLETQCDILPVTLEIARIGGLLRGHLRSAGKVRLQADMWLAATAQIHGLTLVTRNVKDFEGCGIELFDPFT
jgi:predicted nucleic acid-binding protein